MLKRKVVSRQNLPINLPVWQTVSAITALDYFEAPDWMWGAIGFFLALTWLVAVAAVITDEQKSPF